MRNKCMGLQTKAKDKVAINEGEFNPEKNSSFYFGDFITVPLHSMPLHSMSNLTFLTPLIGNSCLYVLTTACLG